MKKEDLKETKIYLSNIEDRIKFQEKMFSLGIKWSDVDGIHCTDFPFYYISEDFYLEYSESTDPAFFIWDSYRQIFLHEVLEIEEPKGVCEFNTFDRVLVRNSHLGLWRAKFFSYYNYENDSFPYVTTDHMSFGICIKYEGNEHLLMTSDSEQ